MTKHYTVTFTYINDDLPWEKQLRRIECNHVFYDKKEAISFAQKIANDCRQWFYDASIYEVKWGVPTRIAFIYAELIKKRKRRRYKVTTDIVYWEQ